MNIQSDKKEILIDADDFMTAKIIITSPSNVDLSRINNYLYSSLSFFDESLKYSWKFKAGIISAKVFLYNRNTQTFAVGMVSTIHKLLKDAFPEYKIKLSKKVWAIFSPPGGKVPTEEFDGFVESLQLYNSVYKEKIVPRDYQMKMLYEALNVRRCSLMACTGSGKSLSLYLMVRWLFDREKKDVLLIVPSKSLVEQMYGDFKNEYGWKDIDNHCSLVHSDVAALKLSVKKKRALEELNLTKDSLLKNVVITTWQSLLHKPPEFFKRFKAVLVDEAHGCKSDSLQTILNLCVNADLKVGVSGTLPESGLDGSLIEGALGARKIIVKTKELIDRGILTPVNILAVMIPYQEDAKKIVHRFDFDGQTALCSYNGSKQTILRMLVESGQVTTSENTIILFKYKKSLDMMFKYFQKEFPEFKCIVYDGDVDIKKREEIRQLLEQNSGYLVFATYGTMKQGINVRRIHNIFFAECSKSLVTVIQSIGRGVRKYMDKVLLKVFDIVDDCSYMVKPRGGGTPYPKLNYAMEHYERRKEYYTFEEFPVTQYTAPVVANVSVDLTNQLKDTKITSKADKKKEEMKIDLENLKSNAGFFDPDDVF